MSTCISRDGEYSDHIPDSEYTCIRCGVLDENGLREELARLRASASTNSDAPEQPDAPVSAIADQTEQPALPVKAEQAPSHVDQPRPVDYDSEASVLELERGLREQPGAMTATTTGRRPRYPLERGWTKHQLIHEIAAMTKTIRLLAEEYDVVPSAIVSFRNRYQAEILAVQQNLSDRFASIPLARKENRLAEYQQDIEDINSQQGATPSPELTRLKHGALKSMAEELGHLPSKTSIQVNNANVSYAFEGVDFDKL